MWVAPVDIDVQAVTISAVGAACALAEATLATVADDVILDK